MMNSIQENGPGKGVSDTELLEECSGMMSFQERLKETKRIMYKLWEEFM